VPKFLAQLGADALLNFLGHHQCDMHNNRFWLIASEFHFHIHIDTFCRSSIGQTTNGYETCQVKNNIYNIRYYKKYNIISKLIKQNYLKVKRKD